MSDRACAPVFLDTSALYAVFDRDDERPALVEALHECVLPWVSVIWVDESLHREAQAALRVAARRTLRLVDCVSFTAMRRSGLRQAFTTDAHFAKQGFSQLPD